MGPVEKELRETTAWQLLGWQKGGVAWKVLKDAAKGLNLGYSSNLFAVAADGWMPDALSEAIEAAETLGL